MRSLDVTSTRKGQSQICERSAKQMARALCAASSATVAGALIFALLFAVGLPVNAQTLTTLYSFKGGSDGDAPNGGLALDAQGNLYGSTYGGGTPHKNPAYGTVFEVSASGAETVLYSFQRAKNGKSPGGANPNGSLVRDSQGNLYGTTQRGGANFNAGALFEVSRSGAETVLHSFSAHRPSKKRPADGSAPLAGVIFDGQSNLYGATSFGGNYNCEDDPYGCGAIFEVTASGVETLLYEFNGGTDGFSPRGPLIFDQEGNLYGTTLWGGNSNCGYGCGVIFKLAPSGAETVLYRFTGGADGGSPNGGLLLDGEGNLYGTAGGGNPNCTGGCGVVFKLSPPGTETVSYSFTGGADGEYPYGGLVSDGWGNLYGVTAAGGIVNSNCRTYPGCGVVFELSPSGTETVLYSFTGGADGKNPAGPLVFDGQGNLYGTAGGGAYGKGTVFKLTP